MKFKEFKKAFQTHAAKILKEDEVLDLKIDIVKHIFEVKSQEMEARKQAMQNRAMKEKLLAIKAEKQDAALQDLSEEQLDKMISELE